MSRNTNKSRGYKSPAATGRNQNGLRKILTASSARQFTGLRLDATLAQIATNLEAEVRITVGPTGTTVGLVHDMTGRNVATDRDMEKLGGMNSFLMKARKDAVSKDKVSELEIMAFRLWRILRRDSYTQKPIDSAMLAALRDLEIRIKNLEINEDLIKANVGPKSIEGMEAFLLKCFVRARNAIVDHAIKVVAGESKVSKLDDAVLARGLPRWLFAKFSSAKLQNFEASADLATLVFPQDISKGINLSVKEWRSSEIITACLMIVRHSHILRVALADDNFLCLLCGVDSDTDFTDETNAQVAQILRAQVAVVPTDTNIRRYATAMSKKKVPSKWASEIRIGVPASAPPAFGHAIIKAQYGLFRSGDRVSEYFDKWFSDVSSLRAKTLSISYNIGHWLLESYPGEGDTGKFSSILGNSDDARAWLFEILTRELGAAQSGSLGKKLREILGLNSNSLTMRTVEQVTKTKSPNGTDLETKSAVAVGPYAWTVYREDAVTPSASWKALQSSMTGEMQDELKEFKKEFVAQKEARKKKAADPMTVALIGIGDKSPAAQLLARIIKEAKNKALAKILSDWFREFSSENLQSAVARILDARFDQLIEEVDIVDDPDEEKSQGDPDSDSELE